MKINVQDNGQFPDVWVFSDPHYNHKNICRGVTNWRTQDGSIPTLQTRDFVSLDKMNASIVNNINECAMQDDILICLGDWSFGGFESIKEFWDRIVCKNIHLILGNHDQHIENNRQECQGLFKSVLHYDVLTYKNEKYVLSHYPMSSWNGLNKGSIMLHGHCHLPTDKRYGSGKRMDVGLDGNPNFGPYNINEISVLMSNREIKSDMFFDHHIDALVNMVG